MRNNTVGVTESKGRYHGGAAARRAQASDERNSHAKNEKKDKNKANKAFRVWEYAQADTFQGVEKIIVRRVKKGS
jgi:hypothetical protein